MLGSTTKSTANMVRGQSGFTLIEMIVVIGIIAVLAAVIIPNVNKFIGSGEDGAKTAELESVQIAMDGMMADKAVQTVVAHNLSGSKSATSTWITLPTSASADPGAVPLNGYLQAGTTVYYYCYQADGEISEQFEAATPCTS